MCIRDSIYVRAASHGRGHGRTLLAAVDAEAARRGADVLWLQVWEHNEAAQAFYARLGWTRAGTHPFLMGTRYEDDWVLVRRVAKNQSAEPTTIPPMAPGPPNQPTAGSSA
jgi:ribosomal protein S18 acetylase RimI-like enzyme